VRAADMRVLLDFLYTGQAYVQVQTRPWMIRPAFIYRKEFCRESTAYMLGRRTQGSARNEHYLCTCQAYVQVNVRFRKDAADCIHWTGLGSAQRRMIINFFPLYWMQLYIQNCAVTETPFKVMT
jgi:hypothetical protein